MQIVKVQYMDSVTKRFSDRAYSYYSEETLAIGNLVIVPVRDTIGTARVCSINVPEATVAAFKDKMKVIPAGSLVKEPVLPVEDMPQELIDILEDKPSVKQSAEPDYTINLCDSCVHELPTCKPAVADFGPNDNVFKCTGHTPKLGNFGEVPKPETKPATVTDDRAFVALKSQIEGIVKYSKSREVKTADDLNAAGNDLIVMRQLEKSVDQLRRQWVDPINAQVKAINDTFKELSTPLAEADKLTGELITKYKNAVDAARKQAEDLNRQANELAQKQAAANNGEFTVDTTPVTAPAPVAKTVRVEAGSVGTRKTRKARVIDFAKLPDTYKLANDRLLNTAASTGVKEIPGVEFYFEESLTTRTK